MSTACAPATTRSADPSEQRPDHFLVGLIGEGIQLSRSPALHETEGAALGLKVHYRIIDLERLGRGPEALPELLAAAELTGFAGLNITHPCKQAVLPLLDELSDAARAIGAVNTVVFRNGRRIGHNTDASGFAEGLRRGLPDAPMTRVVLVGAGGAGAAVGYAALELGAGHLTVFDRDGERAAALADRLCSHFGPLRASASTDLAAALAPADGLIHSTPLGMASHPGTAVPAALLRPALWVAEVVYFPLETELLRTARALGCRTVDGGGMATFQASGAFAWFTGIEPDRERMRAHFLSMLD